MSANSYIPKIQYLNYTTTGDTHTSTTIDDIADTSSIQADMVVAGSGIPTGTTVVSVGANSVVISAATTSTLNNTSLEFYFLLSFSYPPMEDAGEQYDIKERRSVSISGLTQVSVDYSEAVRKVKYRFLTQDQVDDLAVFINDHAQYGNSFKYFESQEVASSVDYELLKFEFMPKRIVYKSGTQSFLYDLEMNFRRVAS